MPEKNQSCSNCYFFLETSRREAQTIGYCRANPPIPYYDKRQTENGETGETETVSRVARFPIVLGQMWCGMWDGRDS